MEGDVVETNEKFLCFAFINQINKEIYIDVSLKIRA